MANVYEVEAWGKTYRVSLTGKRYIQGNNLAISMHDTETYEPFAKLTVNLREGLKENQGYVDTNNCPWAIDFIKKYELGKPTGDVFRSGYCVYPLYEFDMEKLNGKG